MRLTIQHTNDMHGRAEAMARLSHLARRMRADAERRGDQVFFWDGGDPFDRRYRACSMTKGAALARVLNAMGYGLMTMGNDILLTYGPEAMQRVCDRLDFPVLAANCRDGDGPLAPGLEESALLPIPGGGLGVFGLTAPWGGMYSAFGLHFPDTHETARALVAWLRGRGATLLVCLSHLGLSDDRALVDAVPGIDLVIGAHSHDRLEAGEEHAGVLIAQAGQYAEALGVVEIDLDASTGRPDSIRASVLPIPEDEPSDPAVVAALVEAEAEADAVGARPVAELSETLELSHEAECSLGNLTADAFRDRMNAEAAMILSGQLIRALKAGTVTVEDLNEVSTLTANPQRTRVQGKQIWSALERSVDPAVFSQRPHSFRGTPIGWPQISGMNVEWNPAGQVGERIRAIWIAGEPLDPERTYTLAHSDAETMRELAILALEPEQEAASEAEVPTVTREVIEDYLVRHAPVVAPPLGRWKRIG